MFGRGQKRSRNRNRQSDVSVWRHVAYGGFFLGVVALLIVGVWYGSRASLFTITDIHVEGGYTIAHDDVRSVTKTILSGSYLKLIPYTFSLTYPHDELASAIGALPRVEGVSITRDGKRGLIVQFTEHTPFALWCSDGIDPTCFFLDGSGYAFAPSPRLYGSTLVRHVKEGVAELDKDHAFDTASFSALHAFLDILEAEERLRITDVYYTKDGDIELRINGGGSLRIRNGDDYETVRSNLVSILESDAFKHLKPGNFQYIDLRFGNKIFVNEQHLTSETTTPATTTDALPE